jgi:hypothetical protein
MTSEETFGISAGLHTNMSLLWRRKSTSSLSYLGSRVVFGIDSHGLGILGDFESTNCGGHGQTKRHRGYSEAELP